jgi:hypothetical protein
VLSSNPPFQQFPDERAAHWVPAARSQLCCSQSAELASVSSGLNLWLLRCRIEQAEALQWFGESRTVGGIKPRHA